MIAIELSFQQLKDAVSKLSANEKMELNEMIWNDDITIPAEHQDLVKQRIASAKNNPEELLNWDTAINKLRS